MKFSIYLNRCVYVMKDQTIKFAIVKYGETFYGRNVKLETQSRQDTTRIAEPVTILKQTECRSVKFH